MRSGTRLCIDLINRCQPRCFSWDCSTGPVGVCTHCQGAGRRVLLHGKRFLTVHGRCNKQEQPYAREQELSDGVAAECSPGNSQRRLDRDRRPFVLGTLGVRCIILIPFIGRESQRQAPCEGANRAGIPCPLSQRASNFVNDRSGTAGSRAVLRSESSARFT